MALAHGEASRDPLLPDEFAELKDETTSPRRLSITAKHLLGFGAITFVFFALLLLVFSQAQQTSKSESRPEPPDRHHCGRTPEDAVRRNCHYEPMISSWVPDACYFTEASQGYDVYSDLSWYSDPFLKQPLNEEEMVQLRSGNYTHVYTTWQYHDEHCLYVWRKLAMALERRLPLIDSKTADSKHSQHCAKVTRHYVREDEQAEIADLRAQGLKVTMTMRGCVALF